MTAINLVDLTLAVSGNLGDLALAVSGRVMGGMLIYTK